MKVFVKKLVGFYDPESAEILIAMTSITWGVWIIGFGQHIFSPEITIAYQVMAKYGAPWFWGGIAIAQGLFQFFTCRSQDTKIRRWSAFTGICFWGAVLGTIAASDYRLPVVTFVWAFTVTNGWVYLRLGQAERAANCD